MKNALKIFFGFGIGMTLLFLPWNYGQPLAVLLKIMLFNGVIGIVLSFGNAQIAVWVSENYPWLETPVKTFFIALAASLAYTVLATQIFWAAFQWTVYGDPFFEILFHINKRFIITASIITLIIGLFMYGVNFFKLWKQSFLETEELKRVHIEAQYEALKNQIDPHFLFNSFNVLSALVYKDPDLAAKFIKQLSLTYRYVLDTREKEIIPLAEELKALEAYAFLMKIRFGENLDVELNIANPNGEMVVPLTLQMLVENAIKHNEISKAKPLKVEVERDGPGYIVVRNNWQEKKQAQHPSGVGLENIRARYKFVSKKEIEIIKKDGQFAVRIPVAIMLDSHS
ncbi:MAG TPA: histidine kinase [Bacteroidetes bacterium]|nr:histidine kinase [Bacteroidota bacterium]